MKKFKKRIVPQVKQQPVPALNPVDKIIIVGYEVVDNQAIYTVQVGSGNTEQNLTYLELLLAESFHKVPTVYQGMEGKLYLSTYVS